MGAAVALDAHMEPTFAPGTCLAERATFAEIVIPANKSPIGCRRLEGLEFDWHRSFASTFVGLASLVFLHLLLLSLVLLLLVRV